MVYVCIGGLVCSADKNPGKAEFVVQECLNSGTREFTIIGDLADYYDVLTSPRYAEYINPTMRFPNLKLSISGYDDDLKWIDDSATDEEKQA